MPDDEPAEPKIGLALSGGGSRAIAFHLGCLRALHDLGILDRVRVLSTVSGGSVIGASYAMWDGSFEEFDARIRQLLRRGLVRPMIRAAFTTRAGWKAVLSTTIVFPIHAVFVVVTLVAWLLLTPLPSARRPRWRTENWYLPIRRLATRSGLLQAALEAELFRGAVVEELRGRPIKLIVNATELRTGSAFRFSGDESGSYRLGRLVETQVPLAKAVAASAAYPLPLPAFDEDWAFERDGRRRRERVVLTDGGVYDNLGVEVLWPDRDPRISLNVENLDTLICCRAGYGPRHDPPPTFVFTRLRRVVMVTMDRAQNSAIRRLYDMKASGALATMVMPYLGQRDDLMKFAPADLVTREETHDYPTDFSAMEDGWIDLLRRRGEQVTKALVQEHAGELFRSGG